jgi:DNA-binding ferritin-like protein
MATQTKTSPESRYDETADRIRDLNERVIDAGRKAGSTYLDAYEKSLKSLAEYEEKLAEATPVEWLSTVLNAQADFVRDVTRATAQTAREYIK